MSINITSNGSISHNPALDVKSPALEPITEPRPRDNRGRFISSEVTNLDSTSKEVKQQILENDRKLNERDALKEGAPFLYNKSSASGTIFGFHYNCGNLEDIVSHADAIGMLKYMEHYDNIQKFTF